MKRTALIMLLSCLLGTVSAKFTKLNFENFTVQNGLAHNYIHNIFQDSKGWIWVGTSMGIQRFDGYKFRKYGLYRGDTLSISSMVVRYFFETQSGDLLSCSEEYGIAKYNRQLDIFETFTVNGRLILPNYSVKSIAEDEDHNLWVATKQGLQKILPDGNTVSFQHQLGNPNSLCDNYVRKILVQSSSKIWIATRDGLDLFNPQSSTFTHFAHKQENLHDDILEIYIDHNQNLWVGTDSQGIVILNTHNFSSRIYQPDPDNVRSFKVRSIVQDRFNNYWIGTRAGLYYYDGSAAKPAYYEHNVLEGNSLCHSSVLNIAIDAKGDLWVGTRGGLSYLIKERQAFMHYKSIPNNDHYMNNGEIYCFWVDPNGKIWIGTESGGINILDRKTGKFTYLTQADGLSSNCIKALMPDGLGNLLIGSFRGGLNAYNITTGKCTVYMPDSENPASISGATVWSIAKDSKGRIWLATSGGLDLYDPAKRICERQTQIANLRSVSWIGVDSSDDLWLGGDELLIFRPDFGFIGRYGEKTNAFYEDSKGQYWVATQDRGIALYDKQQGPISYMCEKDGLASDYTLSILEDNEGYIWVSTVNGLSRLTPETAAIKNFDKNDGLQGNQFQYGASYKTIDGDLMFGGANGLNVFKPNNIQENNYKAPVYITNLKVFNQTVQITLDKSGILEQAISESSRIEVPHRYNVLTLEFTALNYTNSRKNQYRYMLEGFDNDWIYTREQRSATYTNLNPGEYTFKVLAANSNGLWNDEGPELTLKILPPFYKALWFRILMFMVSLAVIFYLFTFSVKRKNLKNALLFEKEKAQKLLELDTMKFKFFTNISHEIKTPLTLIISPLEKILKVEMEPAEIRQHLKVIQRNANQLFSLVTQLLDYRKLEAGKLELELRKGDIVHFCHDRFVAFEGIMQDKDLTYTFKSVQDEIVTLFDADKLEKIFSNIVSNAIKYTQAGGRISVFLSIVIEDQDEVSGQEDKYIKLVVKDNGVGIQEKNINQIFNRFYRSSESKDISGTGIGLAFTKELVDLHNGHIHAESAPGEGSTFTVLLPYVEKAAENGALLEEDIPVLEPVQINGADSGKLANSDKNLKKVLVVEDNFDVRNFIQSHFEKEYAVLAAKNGKEGYDLAIKVVPDIVISDIDMPLMSGTDMCEKLKRDERTSHIPIVLLSVLSSKEHVVKGLVKGADDYISKPFDITILQKKVENLLLSRKSLRQKYSKELVLKPADVVITSPDERFLQKAIEIVEKNIDDPNLDIEKFVAQIGVSRMQLYRKISALTKMTVKEFINDIRLKRASQLLSENKFTVSEIAYSVGFNDISYFGKCFKKKYGMSATVFAREHASKE